MLWTQNRTWGIQELPIHRQCRSLCPEGPVLRTFGKICSSSFNFLKRWCYSLSQCCDFRYKEIISGVWPNFSSLQNIPFPLCLGRTLNIGNSLRSLLYLLYLKMLLSGCCQVSKTFPGVFPPKQFPGRTFSFFSIQFVEANGEPSIGFSRFCSGEPLEGPADMLPMPLLLVWEEHEPENCISTYTYTYTYTSGYPSILVFLLTATCRIQNSKLCQGWCDPKTNQR